MRNEVLTVEQMYQADQIQINEGTASFELMKAAGQAVCNVIRDNWSMYPVLVVCGAGNNGGDGFVAARLLQDLGWHVVVAFCGDEDALRGDALEARNFWGLPLLPLSISLIDQMPIVVDAVFGVGFHGDLPTELVEFFQLIRVKGCSVVAVDVPSGVNATTGEVACGTLTADRTVTFFRKKVGHLMLPAAAYCGTVTCLDIGIADRVLLSFDNIGLEPTESWCQKALPSWLASQHKYDHGNLCVLGGEMVGAALLACDAARRSGCGLVKLCISHEVDLSGFGIPPGVILKRYSQLCDLKHDFLKADAVLLGCGSSRGLSIDLLKDLKVYDCRFVFDASAAIEFSGVAQEYKDRDVILTPHSGEFERITRASGKTSRLKNLATQELAKSLNATIIAKGADNVVASAAGCISYCYVDAPHLATAGSGDVLAGVVASFAAQGCESHTAASLACWLHGQAGKVLGFGLLAEDLPDAIRKEVRKLTP